MPESWLKIKEWWHDLALREKRFILFGGCCVGFALMYLMIWSPFMEKIAAQRKQIRANQILLAWMRGADKEIQAKQKQIKVKSAVSSPVELLSAVQIKVQESGLDSSLKQLKQLGSDTVTLQFQAVDFDRTIKLLLALAKEQNISITQLSVSADKVPGMVAEDVVLQIK